MSESVRYVRYKSKAGFVARGGPKVEPPTQDLHMARTFYLVAQLEAANWGTVQNYDGAAMSAGPLHVIGVYPATGQQGPLWSMLRRVFDASSSGNIGALKSRFSEIGWNVGSDGVVRNAAGTPVPGATLVEQLSGPGGVVPAAGPVNERAKAWTVAFHRAFTDSKSYAGQYEGTIDWLLANFTSEAAAYDKYVSAFPTAATGRAWLRTANMAQVGPYMDLAMAVYHAFSVNAPGAAKTILDRVLAQNLGEKAFAKALVSALGKSTYGNWIERGRRTMLVVTRSGLWPPAVVEDVYPGARAASMIAYATEGFPYVLVLLGLSSGWWYFFRLKS